MRLPPVSSTDFRGNAPPYPVSVVDVDDSDEERRSSKHRAIPVLVCIAILALAPTMRSVAQVPTPRALALAIAVETDTETTFAVAEPLPNTETRVGFFITCDQARGHVEAGFSFGTFPRNKAVQAAIRTPGGRVERFGPIVRAAPRSGFHSPLLNKPADVRRFLNAAFQHGSLISNGHNSVWNNLTDSLNGHIRTAVGACLETK